jgi:F-type H+-transporting ATPase subunit epsilon
MTEELTLRVITPDRIALDATVSAVQLPGLDGLIGVLPRHAPMVAGLSEGALSYTRGAVKHGLFVSGGFAEVRDNTVRVVSQSSEAPGEIDVERAQRAAERARERMHTWRVEEGTKEFDTLRAEAALRRAMMRIYVKNTFTS